MSIAFLTEMTDSFRQNSKVASSKYICSDIRQALNPLAL